MSYQVTIPFTTGNFDLLIKGTVKDEAAQKYINAGTIYEVQRNGASKTYLEIAGVENDKGKKQLPKDFERKSVEFNDDNLAAMIKGMTGAIQASFVDLTITGSEHVSGAEVSPMKRATEFVDSLLGNAETEAQLRSFLGMFDKTATSADRDSLIAIANANGVGKAKPKTA